MRGPLARVSACVNNIKYPGKMRGCRCNFKLCVNRRLQTIELFANVNWAYIVLMFVQLFVATAEFSTSMSMSTLLTRAVSTSDTLSGIIIGVYSTAAVIWSIMAGPLIDRWGFKMILIVGCLMGAIGRILTATLVFSTIAAGVSITCIMALGDAWTSMAITAATVNFIQDDQIRKVIFGINYSILNMGAIVAGALFDARLTFSSLSNLTPVGDAPSQSLFIIAGLIQSVAFSLSIFLPNIRRTEPVKQKELQRNLSQTDLDPSERLTIEQENAIIEKHTQNANPLLAEYNPAPIGGWVAALSSGSFWRVALYAIVCIGARTVFLHVNITFPTVIRRLYGPNAPVGALYMIDPLLIIVMAPLMQFITNGLRVIPLIIVGTFITGLSPLFFMASSPASAGIIGIILFAVTLSIGEAIWSPLSSFYITEIAGPERVGTYLTMLSLIMFVPTLPMGFYSGLLLQHFCPSNPTQPCQVAILSGIISGVALLTPLLLILFAWLRVIQSPLSSTYKRKPPNGEDVEMTQSGPFGHTKIIPIPGESSNGHSYAAVGNANWQHMDDVSLDSDESKQSKGLGRTQSTGTATIGSSVLLSANDDDTID